MRPLLVLCAVLPLAACGFDDLFMTHPPDAPPPADPGVPPTSATVRAHVAVCPGPGAPTTCPPPVTCPPPPATPGTTELVRESYEYDLGTLNPAGLTLTPRLHQLDPARGTLRAVVLQLYGSMDDQAIYESQSSNPGGTVSLRPRMQAVLLSGEANPSSPAVPLGFTEVVYKDYVRSADAPATDGNTIDHDGPGVLLHEARTPLSSTGLRGALVIQDPTVLARFTGIGTTALQVGASIWSEGSQSGGVVSLDMAIGGALTLTFLFDAPVGTASPLPPAKAVGFTVDPTLGRILAWQPVPGATRYLVFRDDVPGVPCRPTRLWRSVEQPRLLEPNSGTTLYYSVIAAGPTGFGACSDPFTVAPGGTSLPSLSPPAAVSASNNLLNKVHVTWSAGAGAQEYELLRSPKDTNGPCLTLARLDASTLAFDDLTVEPGHTYWYRVRSVNHQGDSGPSTQLAPGRAP